MSITLVLADDHPFFLEGLKLFLALESDFAVVGTCIDGDEALQAVREHRPGILVLDNQMPRMDGMTVLRELRKQKLNVKVVMLTGAMDENEMFEAIRLGARGVVLKEMAPHLLIECLRKVQSGEIWLENRSTGRALEGILRKEASMQKVSKMLTPREIELVRLAASGLGNEDIAGVLHISENTAKIHLHRIYEKLEIKSRKALILRAQEQELTQDLLP